MGVAVSAPASQLDQEPHWLPFLTAARAAGLSFEALARLLLAGEIPFRIPKARGRHVLAMQVEVNATALARLLASRWTVTDQVIADALVNRAALKHRLHPTRHTPGVRGPNRRKALK